jgi:hypothetical protein
MFGGDYRWWLGYSAQIADYKQRDKLFAGKHFRIEIHHPSMASFDNRSVVIFAQIGEEGRLSWRPQLCAPYHHISCTAQDRICDPAALAAFPPEIRCHRMPDT